MGPQFVTGQQAASSSSSTSVAVAFPSNVTAGNMLVATAATDDATIPSATAITDSKGNTWTREATEVGTAGSSSGSLGKYVARNVLAGATTVTFTNGTPFVALSIGEYNPNGQSGTDGTNGANSTSSGTTPAPGNITTTNADDVLIAGATDSLSTVTWIAGASWNLRGNVSSNANTNIAMQDRSVAATGTYSTSFGNTTGNSWAAVAVAIKAVAAAAEPFPAGYYPRPWRNPLLRM